MATSAKPVSFLFFKYNNPLLGRNTPVVSKSPVDAGVWVGVLTAGRVLVGEGVLEAVAVGVAVWVGVLVAVAVNVGVAVAVGEEVAVAVWVEVDVPNIF